MRGASHLWTLGLLLILQGFAAPVATASVNIPLEQHYLMAYLEAESQTSGPRLGLAEGKSPASEYVPPWGATVDSGAQQMRERWTGVRAPSADFPLSAPLDHDVYLNLSTTVKGRIYYSATTQSHSDSVQAGAEGRPGDNTQARVEVYAGTKRLGGQDYVLGTGYAHKTWDRIDLSFRAELSMIPAGEKITVKVYRLAGLADFRIGTGGTHQGYVNITYFLADPLAGTAYLEGGKLYATGGDGGGPVGGSPSYAWAGLAGLALMRPRRASLVAALLLFGALAGCIGSQGSTPNGTESASPSVSLRYENQTTDGSIPANEGGLRARIVDEFDFPIKGAHLAILGTRFFSTTDVRGEATILNITPGTYQVRVDAVGFPPVEHPVDIEGGRMAVLEIQMRKPGQGGMSGTSRHFHDDWNGELSKVLGEGDVVPTSTDGTQSSSSYTCVTAYSFCAATFGLPEGVVVPPGATRVEIILDWPAGSNAPPEAGLLVKTAGIATPAAYVPRPAKEPFNVVVFPDEADVGHAKASTWSFEVRLRATNNLYYSHGGYALLSQGSKIHWKVTAFKGVVPLEPPHRDLWNGEDKIVVFKGTTLTVGTICCTGPYYPGNFRLSFPPSKWVPVGAKEFKGTVKWSPDVPGVTWTVMYQSSDIASTSKVWRAAKMGTVQAGSAEFVIAPKDSEVDQFYQKVTGWRVSVDNNLDPNLDTAVNPFFTTTFTFDGTVYKDPAYVFQ